MPMTRTVAILRFTPQPHCCSERHTLLWRREKHFVNPRTINIRSIETRSIRIRLKKTFHSSCEQPQSIKVWDLLVRLFHWTLVINFVLAFSMTHPAANIHRTAGYSILLLITVRIVWGISGSGYARFNQFVPSIADAFDYLVLLSQGRQTHYLGHNPAGALMVVLLLMCLTLLSISGIMVDVTQIATSQLQPDPSLSIPIIPSTEHRRWIVVHKLAGYITLMLVGLHISGVLLMSYLLKENLPLAMITGNKHLITQPENKSPH